MKTMKETLSNCLCGIKHKAHGAQEPRHINRIVEVASTAQRVDSPAQAINQCFLKRASNSLLILLYPFMALLRTLTPSAPASGVGASQRRSSSCFFRSGESALCRVISQASCSLRSFTPTWLGEERVRGLIYGFLAFCILVPYAAGETPASAAEEISAIIRAEITAMTEWNDADIRVEITGEIKSAPDESFRLAPEGLTIGRRNVLAPVEVIQGGKTMRTFWVPAVVHVSRNAVVASRKIALGEIITEDNVCESRIETTDINSVLTLSLKDITGKIARRSFAAGEPLPQELFSEPLLVRRGDMVSLRLERSGIALTSAARAAENGRFGDVIRVKNVDFSSVVRARVTGPAEVSIQ